MPRPFLISTRMLLLLHFIGIVLAIGSFGGFFFLPILSQNSVMHENSLMPDASWADGFNKVLDVATLHAPLKEYMALDCT